MDPWWVGFLNGAVVVVLSELIAAIVYLEYHGHRDRENLRRVERRIVAAGGKGRCPYDP